MIKEFLHIFEYKRDLFKLDFCCVTCFINYVLSCSAPQKRDFFKHAHLLNVANFNVNLVTASHFFVYVQNDDDLAECQDIVFRSTPSPEYFVRGLSQKWRLPKLDNVFDLCMVLQTETPVFYKRFLTLIVRISGAFVLRVNIGCEIYL